jgi:hypothetical protein
MNNTTYNDCNIFPEYTSCFDFTMGFHGYAVPSPDEYHSYLCGRVALDEMKYFCEAL